MVVCGRQRLWIRPESQNNTVMIITATYGMLFNAERQDLEGDTSEMYGNRYFVHGKH